MQWGMIDGERQKVKFAQPVNPGLHWVYTGSPDCGKFSAGKEGLGDLLVKRSKEIASLLFPV